MFQFKTATTEQSLADAVRVLSAVDGVGTVTPSLLRNELSVQFNPDRASKQSLRAVLANAGYDVMASNPSGGCGGGGGGCSCS
ncbi:heavy-metal-associated domain-containing protein [Noviherbaspirillum sp. UKPF54]|uniref:heavy-metal-associated domain-containing protein n=1 Tax=Noviherbaspirillum sp. UKPF54 TaxID=2601898 RepID=UPI0011B13C89|nr:heavy-metal-associated domain-containing protein [Noviherbaspirillum sp. UKPF54]QDZ29103.1 heavy-metal-associated domain-containing protein [Noviherbaspirillum sp. UKPF54]